MCLKTFNKHWSFVRKIQGSFVFLLKAIIMELEPHQAKALALMGNGKILCGGTGTGKSITSLAYYFTMECNGDYTANPPYMKTPKDLYIITTARKRNTLEWEGDCTYFRIGRERENSIANVGLSVDSWNNIKKYEDVKDAFFIFDEQRLVGSGAWVKSFYKIVKNNRWVLLSATPGDTWKDYIPVFVANGFYKNRSDFLRDHAVYSQWTNYPKIDRYVETHRLERYRRELLVPMPYKRKTVVHRQILPVGFERGLFNRVMKDRWNIFEDRPIKDASEYFYTMRKVVNTDYRRLEEIKVLIDKHPKLIVFYNFNYELELLRDLEQELNVPVREYNRHKHESIPDTESWIYLVQYTAGSEAWNCIQTNAIVFYSLNYSYRTMTQSEGRIDRMNTPYIDLYYYTMRSNSPIDLAITKALKEKRDFNERTSQFKTFKRESVEHIRPPANSDV